MERSEKTLCAMSPRFSARKKDIRVILQFGQKSKSTGGVRELRNRQTQSGQAGAREIHAGKPRATIHVVPVDLVVSPAGI